MRTGIVRASVGLLLCGCGAALAQQVPTSEERSSQGDRTQLQFSVADTYTDNARRTPVNEVDDQIVSLGVNLDINHDGRLVDYRAAGDLAWQDYTDNSYASQVLGHFDGQLDATLIQDRLTWDVKETFGQVTANPLVPQTPDTLSNLNYFSTGPRFSLPIGTQTAFQLAGDYSRTDSGNEESGLAGSTADLSGERYLGSVALIRRLSPRSSISLQGDTEHFEYDDESIVPSYDQRHAFVRFEARGARNTINTDLGWVELDSVRKTSGLLARIEVQRRLTPAQTLSLRADQSYSGAGDALRSGLDLNNPVIASTPISTTDPYKDRSVGLGWRYAISRTELTVDLSRSKEQYQTQTQFDRTRKSISAYATRRLTPRLDLRMDALYTREDYPVTGYDDKELDASLGLNWHFGRHVTAGLRYSRLKRTSSDPTTEYAENRIGLAFFVSPLRPQSQ